MSSALGSGDGLASSKCHAEEAPERSRWCSLCGEEGHGAAFFCHTPNRIGWSLKLPEEKIKALKLGAWRQDIWWSCVCSLRLLGGCAAPTDKRRAIPATVDSISVPDIVPTPFERRVISSPLVRNESALHRKPSLRVHAVPRSNVVGDPLRDRYPIDFDFNKWGKPRLIYTCIEEDVGSCQEDTSQLNASKPSP